MITSGILPKVAIDPWFCLRLRTTLRPRVRILSTSSTFLFPGYISGIVKQNLSVPKIKTFSINFKQTFFQFYNNRPGANPYYPSYAPGLINSYSGGLLNPYGTVIPPYSGAIGGIPSYGGGLGGTLGGTLGGGTLGGIGGGGAAVVPPYSSGYSPYSGYGAGYGSYSYGGYPYSGYGTGYGDIGKSKSSKLRD